MFDQFETKLMAEVFHEWCNFLSHHSGRPCLIVFIFVISMLISGLTQWSRYVEDKIFNLKRFFFFFYEKEIQVPNIKLDSRTRKRITEVRAAEIYSISAQGKSASGFRWNQPDSFVIRFPISFTGLSITDYHCLDMLFFFFLMPKCFNSVIP